jgi:hypothetical protein
MKAAALLLVSLAGLLAGHAAQAEEPAPTPPSVTLHVESPYVVDVERRDSPRQPWASVCVNPCDAAVPVEGEYRVRGRGVTSSVPFRLAPRGEAATVDVTPGNKKKLRTGWFLVSGGVAAALVGSVIDGVGTMAGSVAGQGDAGDSGKTSNTRQNLYLGGTLLVIAGLATAFYGGSLVFNNQHSGVKETDTPPPPPDPPPPAAAWDLEEKAPETALFDRAPSFVIPVFSGAF